MTKRIQAKYKIDRRYGINLWGRPKSPVNKREYGPGEHGQRKGKMTDYGIQLAAKQKLRCYYGNITEKQFRGLYQEAVRRKGDTGENLVGLLERRLDAVVYRLRWVSTVFAARQMVNHGHIRVNGKRVNIASYQVRDGDVIELKASMHDNINVLSSIASQERQTPEYIESDEKKFTAKYLRAPALDEVAYPVQMEPNLVIEFYSR